ncbi:MAG: 4'-phosphopantetheinyl transferase superfamily protein [bacterium]
MLVGNDLVDLLDPQADPRSIHQGFDARVMTTEENRLVLSALDPHRLRWMLWAAKESAFKVVKKMDPSAVFHPKAFEVDLTTFDGVHVRHSKTDFETVLFHSPKWVHAVTTLESRSAKCGSRLHSRVLSLESRNGPFDSSMEVRTFTRKALGSWLGISWAEVEIVTENRIPRVTRGGKRLEIDLSLAHDGNFVACAWKA